MRVHTSRVWFSEVEKVDLLKAWIATSLAFGIFFLVTRQAIATGFWGFLMTVGLAAVTAGLGFIAHELSHKFTANRFGVHAEFRSNDMMLVVAILFSFLGFIIAAPGAVMIMGHISRRENGIISAAGPAANLVLALLFLPLIFAGNKLLVSIGMTGLLINAMLGVFNMIPIWQFDGTKILAWNKVAYFSMLALGGLLLVLAFTIGT